VLFFFCLAVLNRGKAYLEKKYGNSSSVSKQPYKHEPAAKKESIDRLMVINKKGDVVYNIQMVVYNISEQSCLLLC